MKMLASFFSAEVLTQLQAISRVVPYKKGNILFYQGEKPLNVLYLLTKGCVQVHKTQHDHMMVLHYFRAIEFVGVIANLRGSTYPATAEFQTDGEVWHIDEAAFKAQFLSDPMRAFVFINELIHKINILEERLQSKLKSNVKSRVAALIHERIELFSAHTQKELAAMLEIRHETLNRTLKELQDEGLIVKDKKTVRVTNEAALLALATAC